MRDWEIRINDFFVSQDRNWRATWVGSKLIPYTTAESEEELESQSHVGYKGYPVGILHSVWNGCPETYFRVSNSGNQKGLPHEFVSRENTFCWTTNRKLSWYKVDLGKYVKIIPSYYTLKYGSSANYCCPRSWKLQASNDERAEVEEDESIWTTLRVHDNDNSMDADFAWIAYRVESCTTAYRYFRVVQHGSNAFVTRGGPTPDVWGDVFVATGFDLFGLCIKVKPSPNDPLEIRQRV